MLPKKQIITRPRILLGLILLFLLTGLKWLNSHAYIELSGEERGEIEIILKNSSSKQETRFTFSGGSTKRLLGSGNYEISARGEKGSYFQITKIGKFLGTTKISLSLSSENARSFIGDNPRECVQLLNRKLISLDCGSAFSDLGLHLPATDSVPSYVRRNSTEVDLGNIEGVIKTKNNKLVGLFYQPEVEGYAVKSHVFYELKESKNKISLKYVSDAKFLSANSSYSMVSTEDSVIIFDDSYQNIFVGPDIASLKRVEAYPEDKKSFELGYFTSSGEVNLFAQENLDKKYKNIDDSKKETQVTLMGESNLSSKLAGTFSEIKFCGVQNICLLDYSNSLRVLDMKLKEITKITDVTDFSTAGEKILLVTGAGIINFDISNKSGYYAYWLGDYSFLGIESVSNDEYVVALGDSSSSYGLLLNISKRASDEIDKKVYELRNSQYIKAVSAYGKRIFISPELGELEFSTKKGYFDYSTKRKTEAGKSISALIDSLRIDRSVYTIKINNL